MSERGSQGYIYEIPDSTAYLVLYLCDRPESKSSKLPYQYQNIYHLYSKFENEHNFYSH